METADRSTSERNDERRSTQRQRAFKGATLTFNRGYGALEGLVRNISPHGAGLKFGDTSAVPPIFELRISGEHRIRTAHVRWRSLTDVGIEFDQTVVL